MGYDTSFEGHFDITPPLSPAHERTIAKFTQDRHEGAYDNLFPSYYCPWETDAEGAVLRWDGQEKANSYVEWLEYLIKNFFAPWGYTLNGSVLWNGEERGDLGKIVIKNNLLKALEAKRVVYGDEDDE